MLIDEKFKTHTLLNTSQDGILMQIENKNLLIPLEPMKVDPNKKDRSKYCCLHKNYKYLTTKCLQDKKQIEALIQKGSRSSCP